LYANYYKNKNWNNIAIADIVDKVCVIFSVNKIPVS
jgi:hypothetical protein